MKMDALMNGKSIRVLILAGVHDLVVPGEDQIEIAQHF